MTANDTDPTTIEPVVSVTGLDHIVLMTSDAERSLDFYCGTLGLEGDRVDEWRKGEVPFPSVRIDGATIIDLFPTSDGVEVKPGNLDHFCLTVTATDLQALADSGLVSVVRGPQGGLFGAQGYATSLYIADPDGNTVELRNY